MLVLDLLSLLLVLVRDLLLLLLLLHVLLVLLLLVRLGVVVLRALRPAVLDLHRDSDVAPAAVVLRRGVPLEPGVVLVEVEARLGRVHPDSEPPVPDVVRLAEQLQP